MAETTITFKVLGMTCTMCALTIKRNYRTKGLHECERQLCFGGPTVMYDKKRIAPPQGKPTPHVTGKEGVEPMIEEVVIPVKGMACASCAMKVEAAVKALRGVKSVRVDATRGDAKLLIDVSITSLDEVRVAIKGCGYEADACLVASQEELKGNVKKERIQKVS